jgi:hypothetical protein
LLAIGLILAPAAIAQTGRTEPAPKASSPDAGCTTRTTTSTYLTPHAAVDVKDTTFCFDPATAWMTAGSPHQGADFPPGSSVALTATPNATSNFYSWSGGIASPSAGSVIVMDISGSMSGHVAVASDALAAFSAILATEGTYEIRILNAGNNQSKIGDGVLPRLVLAFSDGVGDPFFVPADPGAPVQFKKADLPFGSAPVNWFLHADQLGGYAALVTLSGRRLRAITIRPRVAGILANPPPVHHHVFVGGARGETASVDIDEGQIRPPSLTSGPPAESQCMVLIRRVLTDGVLSVSGSVPEACAIHRPVGGAAITGSLSAPGILPLRI